jgi:hypothetical protein
MGENCGISDDQSRFVRTRIAVGDLVHFDAIRAIASRQGRLREVARGRATRAGRAMNSGGPAVAADHADLLGRIKDSARSH